MTPFGDDDPEDAYDATDPPADRFAVIARVVPSIIDEQADPGHDGPRVRARIGGAFAVLDDLERARDVDLGTLDDLRDDLLAAADAEGY